MRRIRSGLKGRIAKIKEDKPAGYEGYRSNLLVCSPGGTGWFDPL